MWCSTGGYWPRTPARINCSGCLTPTRTRLWSSASSAARASCWAAATSSSRRRILDRIGAENVVILAAAGKVSALDPPVLRVDVGDDAPASVVSGYHRVHTAPGRSIVLKVSSG